MANYYRKTGFLEYGLLAVAVLLVLNWLGIDLLEPRRKNESYDDEKPEYDVNKANVSYSKAAFERLCTRLVHAMDTDELTQGTYEEDVYDVYKYMHNLDDVHELYNVFGIRTYGGDEWGQWQIEADPKYNLQTWIDKELEQEEKDVINKILKDKGINFKV